MIVIIDYGMGNLHSVANALKQINCEYLISNKKEDIIQADGLILPGVGAFKDCMGNLHKSGLIDTIKVEVAAGKPLLGICLGMQVLFEIGYEGEETQGLGLLKGEVVLMRDQTVKIPHMGWNQLEKKKEDSLFNCLKEKAFVYFVHSYYVQNYEENDLVAYASYGALKIPAYVRKQNVLGMQYHPEKSGEEGLKMLCKFKEMCI